MATIKSRPRLRLPSALRQVMLIEGLPDERFDDGLPAHVKVPSCVVQFFQHGRSEIHIHPLNRLHHAALALKETRNTLPLIG